MSLTDKTLRKFKQRIRSLSLAPFADGRFEVFLDGKLVHSKLKTGDFPDEDRLLQAMEKTS